MLGNRAGDIIHFDPGQGRSGFHFGRHQAEEVANTHRRFEYTPRLEAELIQNAIDRLDHRLAGVVSVKRRSAGSVVLFVAQQCPNFSAPLLPALAPNILTVLTPGEDGLERAPANIASQDRLLLGRGPAITRFQLPDQPDGRDVVLVFLDQRALTEAVGVGDDVISGSVRYLSRGAPCGPPFAGGSFFGSSAGSRYVDSRSCSFSS